MNTRDKNIEHQTSNSKREFLIIRLITFWFVLQVVLNVVSGVYLTLYPPDQPISWFDRVDLLVNTGINAALAVGFWGRTTWAWSTAVWLVPLYWTIHLWHMLVPEEGLLLWPFLMIDALILGWLLGSKGRGTLKASPDRWPYLSLLPAPMFALALYALLAPIIGMFVAIPVSAAVIVVGWRKGSSRFQISDSRLRLR